MCTFNTATTEGDPGLDSMTEAWKVHLCGQRKKQAILDSGLRNSQTTGKTKTVCTLLAPSTGILGMMYRAIAATTSLALKVKLYIGLSMTFYRVFNGFGD